MHKTYMLQGQGFPNLFINKYKRFKRYNYHPYFLENSETFFPSCSHELNG